MTTKPCEYCGAELPLALDLRTRRERTHHFETCSVRLKQKREYGEIQRAIEEEPLANCQTQLQIAIGHLKAMLYSARTADQQLAADSAARDWLASIGAEPD